MARSQPSPATARFGQNARPARLCNLDRLFDAMEARGLDGLLSYYSRNVTYLGGYASGSTAIYGEAVPLPSSFGDMHARELDSMGFSTFLPRSRWRCKSR